MHYVMELVDNELSEPYSIFTYRYSYHCCHICHCTFFSCWGCHEFSIWSLDSDRPCDRQVLPAQLAQAVLASL